jgi:hypothetical protein
MKGSCLCGSVGIETADHSRVSACHCGMCRRWGGGPLLAVHCGTQVTITGVAHITAFKSSDWAERAFCAKCGTHLYYKLLPAGEYIVPAGLFQDVAVFTLEEQIFIDNKPAYYAFENRTRLLTQSEVFAQYAPPQK